MNQPAIQFTIVKNAALEEQFRFPRSKKRRTRLKWAIREENWRPMRRALVIGDEVHMHPAFHAEFVKDLEKTLASEARLDWQPWEEPS